MSGRVPEHSACRNITLLRNSARRLPCAAPGSDATTSTRSALQRERYRLIQATSAAIVIAPPTAHHRCLRRYSPSVMRSHARRQASRLAFRAYSYWKPSVPTSVSQARTCIHTALRRGPSDGVVHEHPERKDEHARPQSVGDAPDRRNKKGAPVEAGQAREGSPGPSSMCAGDRSGRVTGGTRSVGTRAPPSRCRRCSVPRRGGCGGVGCQRARSSKEPRCDRRDDDGRQQVADGQPLDTREVEADGEDERPACCLDRRG